MRAHARVLRRLAAFAAVGAALLAVPAPAGATTLANADTLETAVFKRINYVRASHGLRKLGAAQRLKTAGTKHAANMALKGYFSHSWSTGASFGKWIQWYYPGPGYSSWEAGENLFWATPSTTARAVVRAWMRSSGHRANILRPAWRQLGVGSVAASNPISPWGAYDRVVLVAAEFGRRS